MTALIVERLPTTIELSIAAMAFSVLSAYPWGSSPRCATTRVVDVVTMIIANIGVSMPVFWLGLMLAYIFALLLKGTPFWLPPSGRLSAGMSPPAFYQVWELDKIAPPFLLGLV